MSGHGLDIEIECLGGVWQCLGASESEPSDATVLFQNDSPHRGFDDTTFSKSVLPSQRGLIESSAIAGVNRIGGRWTFQLMLKDLLTE